MIYKENVSETKYPKPTINCEPAGRDTVPMKFCRTDTVVVLDMGEASREEGFRLNGCR